MFGNILEKLQNKRISKNVYLIQGVAGNSRLKCGCVYWPSYTFIYLGLI